MSYGEEAKIDIMIAEFTNMLSDEAPLSEAMHRKVGMYSVTDEDIKEFLFRHSVLDICILADRVVQLHYISQEDLEASVIINIASMGITRKYLTDKQKWRVASFIIYWTRESQKKTKAEKLGYTLGKCPECDGTGNGNNRFSGSPDLSDYFECPGCGGDGVVRIKEL